MFKKIIPFLIVLLVIGGVLYIRQAQKPAGESALEQEEQVNLPDKAAGLEKSPEAALGFKRFIMEKEYFLCDIPETWEFSQTDKRKKKRGVYGIELIEPERSDAPTLVRVKFYLNNNKYFKGYNDFIESNSKDIFGDTKTETDTYGPVEKVKLNNRIAYRFESEIKEYTEPESKSGKFIMLREKFYVIPCEKGFHVLQFMSSGPAYSKNLPVFEEIVYSFRGV